MRSRCGKHNRNVNTTKCKQVTCDITDQLDHLKKNETGKSRPLHWDDLTTPETAEIRLQKYHSGIHEYIICLNLMRYYRSINIQTYQTTTYIYIEIEVCFQQ